MDTIADRDLLTEGSVWIRENGKKNIVLFLTNRTLSGKIQKSHPPQVVYTDEVGNSFNQTVTNFLKTRTFLNVNPTMETRCLTLTLNMEEDDLLNTEDTLVLAEDEDEVIEGGPEDDSVIARFMAGAESPGIDPNLTIDSNGPIQRVEFFVMNDAALPAAISAEALQEALASYEVAPNLERVQMVHTLSFRCEDAATANDIFKSFHGLNYDKNVLYGFNIASPANANGKESVSWVASLGTYPYIVDGESFVRVLVLTPSPVPAELPLPDSEVAEESTVQPQDEVGNVPSDLLERVEAVINAESQAAPQTLLAPAAQ